MQWDLDSMINLGSLSDLARELPGALLELRGTLLLTRLQLRLGLESIQLTNQKYSLLPNIAQPQFLLQRPRDQLLQS